MVTNEPRLPEALERLRAAQLRKRAVARRLVGLNLHEANELAARSGCQLPVVMRDGKGLTVTADLVTNRIDIEIEGDTVVGA